MILHDSETGRSIPSRCLAFAISRLTSTPGPIIPNSDFANRPICVPCGRFPTDGSPRPLQSQERWPRHRGMKRGRGNETGTQLDIRCDQRLASGLCGATKIVMSYLRGCATKLGHFNGAASHPWVAWRADGVVGEAASNSGGDWTLLVLMFFARPSWRWMSGNERERTVISRAL
jgi:hypothetical protein